AARRDDEGSGRGEYGVQHLPRTFPSYQNDSRNVLCDWRDDRLSGIFAGKTRVCVRTAEWSLLVLSLGGDGLYLAAALGEQCDRMLTGIGIFLWAFLFRGGITLF